MSDVEDYTQKFLECVGLGMREMMPCNEKCREFKVYKLFANLAPGDHVAVWRNKRGYWHHGIYYGEDHDGDAFVVDLTPESGIALCPYEKFIHHEDAAIIVDYEPDSSFTKEYSLKFADFVLEHVDTCPVKYDHITKNSDKLALMIRTGRAVSGIVLKNPLSLHSNESFRDPYGISAKLGLKMHDRDSYYTSDPPSRVFTGKKSLNKSSKSPKG